MEIILNRITSAFITCEVSKSPFSALPWMYTHWLVQLVTLFGFAGLVLLLIGPSEVVAPDMEWQKTKTNRNAKVYGMMVGRIYFPCMPDIKCTVHFVHKFWGTRNVMLPLSGLSRNSATPHEYYNTQVLTVIIKCFAFDKMHKIKKTQPNIPAIFHIPP